MTSDLAAGVQLGLNRAGATVDGNYQGLVLAISASKGIPLAPTSARTLEPRIVTDVDSANFTVNARPSFPTSPIRITSSDSTQLAGLSAQVIGGIPVTATLNSTVTPATLTIAVRRIVGSCTPWAGVVRLRSATPGTTPIEIPVTLIGAKRVTPLALNRSNITLHAGEEDLVEPRFPSSPPVEHCVSWTTGSSAVAQSIAQPGRTFIYQNSAMIRAIAPGLTSFTVSEGGLSAAGTLLVLDSATIGTPTLLAPRDGVIISYSVEPRKLNLSWTSVPRAVSYQIDVQGCIAVEWLADWQNTCASFFSNGVTQATDTTLVRGFMGDQPGRWRVRAVDVNGVPGRFSGWHEFSFAFSR